MGGMADLTAGSLPKRQGQLRFDGYIDGVGGGLEDITFTPRDVELAALALFEAGKKVPTSSQAAIVANAYTEGAYIPEALQMRHRSSVWALDG